MIQNRTEQWSFHIERVFDIRMSIKNIQSLLKGLKTTEHPAYYRDIQTIYNGTRVEKKIRGRAD